MSPTPPAAERRDADTAPRAPWVVERAVEPFFRDAGLWPVTAVVIAHLVLGVAVLLLDVSRSPGPFSLAALGALVLASLEVLRRAFQQRRLGALAATVLASWALGALAAWAADRAGLY